ncbi:MAG: hypothetical protein NW206_08625 [Hyphomonadaceae bacterium]|nr:hypothetical protein [Hyphomonadaceae bacterium]
MPAHAGAWIAPEGGQRIWTELAGERDDAFYSESSIYWEEPLGEGVAVVVAPWVTQEPQQYNLDGLRWEVTVAGKAATHRGERSVTALQAGVVWNSDPPADCAEAQAELRWLGGRSIGERSFVNLEAAERVGDEGCGGERVDLTLGHRFDQRWLGMAQIFVDEPRLGDSAVKAQISLVRFGAEGRGLQVGLRARVDGGAMEPALMLGFWGQGRR